MGGGGMLLDCLLQGFEKQQQTYNDVNNPMQSYLLIFIYLVSNIIYLFMNYLFI